ncbi:CapA family protein [Bacteroides fragilis]
MIRILITGDYCPRNRIDDLINLGKYQSVFEDIIPIVKGHDYSIVNLECPVVEHDDCAIKKQGPNLSSSLRAVEILKLLDFNLLTLANNHFYDYGDGGVKHTLECCKNLDLDFVGGGESLSAARAIKFKNLFGKRFAFINVCEHEFSIATQTTGGSNPLNPISNYYDIQKARATADYVIIIVHGGHEHYQLPSLRMQETYRFFIDAGADVVVNHHQHCFSGYEIYNNKYIFYGLGNFCFDNPVKRNSIWNEGYMLSLNFSDYGKIDFSLIPYIQCDQLPKVRLLKESEKAFFFDKISSLNKIIQSPDMLKDSFYAFCMTKRRLYLSLFEPYPGRYLKYIYRMGYLPSFLFSKTRLFIQNFMDCESHHDIVKEVIKINRK